MSSPRVVTFQTPGHPVTQGSLKPVPAGRGPMARDRFKRALSWIRIVDDNPDLKAWRNAMAWSAKDCHVWPLWTGPVRVWADFFVERVDKDTDKLLRALLDALSGVVYVDDQQVCEAHVRRFDTRGTTWAPGVKVQLEELEPRGLIALAEATTVTEGSVL